MHRDEPAPTGRGRWTPLRSLIHRQVTRAPGATAVIDHHGRRLDYAGLWQAAGQVADALRQHGTAPGDPVVIAADRSLEMVVAILATLRAGAWYVLADPHAPLARHQAVCAETAPRAVLVAPSQPPWPAAPRVPRVPVVWDLDADAEAGADAETDACPDGSARGAPGTGAGGDDLAYVAYTSGSSGRPKGIRVPHRAVVNFVTGRRLVALEPGHRVASQTNPASDATTFEVLSPLVAGATVVVLPLPVEVGVEEWLRVVAEQRVDVMFLMTPLFDLIARETPGAFRSLHTLVFGGDAPNIAIVRAVCAAGPPDRLVLGYGPTEATVFATRFLCTEASLAGRDHIPLGSPLENYRVHVLDEDLRPVGEGGSGELYVAGPGVADGYVSAAGSPGPFVALPDGSRAYRSGDVVRLGAEGELRFVGRVDRQVKIRGFRVEPGEVERAVLATGLVSAAVVCGAGEAHRRHLVCFYTAEPGSAAPRELVAEARGRLADALPGYMVPGMWRAVDHMPLTANGKTDREHLLSTLPGVDADD